MSLFINKEFNSLVITSKDFKEDFNYLPDIMIGLRNLDPSKNIKIAFDLEETPAIFILYFKKVLEEADADIVIYYKEKTDSVRGVLKSYGMPYNNIKKYPDPLPKED